MTGVSAAPGGGQADAANGVGEVPTGGLGNPGAPQGAPGVDITSPTNSPNAVPTLPGTAGGNAQSPGHRGFPWGILGLIGLAGILGSRIYRRR